MTQQLSLERMVADWMADEAAGGLPDQVVDQILTTTSRTRPLPRWRAVLKESPMHAQTRPVVGVPTRQLVLIGALLLLAAAIVIGAAAAFLLRPPPAADGWPGFRGDAARNGTSVQGPIGNPVVAWEFKAGAGIRRNLSVAGDLVLAPTDDGILHAIRIDSGSEAWRFTAAEPMRGPFATDGRVYVADGAGLIHALGLSDGTSIWTATEAIESQSDITVVGSHLYVGTGDGRLVAIDTSTGAEAWRMAVSPGSVAVATVAASADAVAVTTDDHFVAVLDPDTGAIRWRQEVGVDAIGTPVIADGTVYVGGAGDVATGSLVAYDLANGTERWRIHELISSPVVVDGIGYTGSAAGTVAALDLATGDVRWRASFNGNVRAPAVVGDVVYLSVDGERRIVALDRATGGELWGFDLDGPNDCCIAAARGLAFVGTAAGTVYAIGGDGAKLVPKAVPTAAVLPPPPVPSEGSALPPLETGIIWAVDSGAADFLPWDLTQAPDGRLWTVEGFSDRISIFTTDGDYVESWGTSGTADGAFDLTRGNGDPYGAIAFAPDGSFYVLDVGNHRVQQFDTDRRFVRAWGTFGTGPGQFNDPVGLAVDADGQVHVLDDVRGVIETFDAEGNVLGSIPAFPGLRPGTAANGLSIGPNGHFFVTVVGPNEVIELDREGALIATYGAPGSGDGAFNEQPFTVAFDAQGRVYVTQGPTRGDRPGILVFDSDASYLGGFGPLGGADDELGFPWGVVVTDDGIYVSDVGGMEPGLSSRIRKFEPIAIP